MDMKTFLLLLACFGLVICDIGSTPDDKNSTLHQLREVHKSQMKTLSALISLNLCDHMYFDLGSNLGVQIRKLYQPEGYPRAPILPFFDAYFGTDSHSRKHVCSVGFEPNHVHTDRLINLQQRYRNASFPCVIFTDTAIGTEDGTIDFYNDPSISIEWGASTINWQNNSKIITTTSLQIDANRFFHQTISHLKKSSSYTNNTKVIAKMDIEGGEFEVIPTMLAHGSLCLIDFMMLEWHHRFIPNAEEEIEKMLVYMTTHSKHCKFKIIDLDDESYAFDNNFPLPPEARKLLSASTLGKMSFLSKL